MRGLPNHDNSAATGPDGSRRKPVWPEKSGGQAESPDLSELSGDEFLTTAQAERFHDAAAAELTHRELELERRERSLAEQAAALEQDRRKLRHSEQEIDQRRDDEDSKAAAAQAELNSRLARCEELIADLEREQNATEAERGYLQSQRETLRETVLDEQALERQQLVRDRELFQAEKKEFRQRVENHEREMLATHDELHTRWESERQALRDQLTAKIALELSEQRQSFDEERAAWENDRDREREALDNQRAGHEKLLTETESGLGQIRQELEQEFQQRRRALEAEIGTQVQTLETKLAEQQTGWETSRREAETELETLRAELENQRAVQEQTLETARAKFEEFREFQLQRIEDEALRRRTEFDQERSEWIAERDAVQSRLDSEAATIEELKVEFDHECAGKRTDLDSELDRRRDDAERELAAERGAFERECDSLRRAIDEERAVMENRLHFQRDHLDRTRDELETARLEVDLQIQKGRTRAVALSQQGRLRRGQLDRFRELLDQREASLERERRMLAEARARMEADRADNADCQRGESELPRRDRQVEQLAEQELRDELAGRAKQLAERQSRLDTLRVEIESTHRDNLELRVALDEAWGRLERVTGPERAKGELLVSRELVADYFHKKDAEIEQQRALLASESEAARKQRENVDHRRRELTDWLAGSLAALRRREEHLQRWSGILEAREARGRQSAARWQDDKGEAERVIRNLLKQLEQATAGPPRLALDDSLADRSETPARRRAAG